MDFNCSLIELLVSKKEDFYVNISTEIIGVLLSIILGSVVIGGAIKYWENRRWRKVKKYVNKRILGILFWYFFYSIQPLKFSERGEGRNVPLEYEGSIPPKDYEQLVNKYIPDWKIHNWEYYSKGLNNLIDGLTKIIDVYQIHLTHKILELFLEIEEKSNTINSHIQNFAPDKYILDIMRTKYNWSRLASDMTDLYKLVHTLSEDIEND